MTRLFMHGLLASTLTLAPMVPAWAADSEPRRLENSLTEIGLRGPFFLSPAFDLGWDTRYRSEIYFTNDPGFGLGYSLGEKSFLQANAYLSPGDSYGTQTQMLLAGFGKRL